MQRTRLSTLVDSTANQFSRWVFNPWRRLSLVMIGFLFGNFFGIAISSIAGQKAELDVVISAILLGLVELTSWWVYRRPARDDTGRKKTADGSDECLETWAHLQLVCRSL